MDTFGNESAKQKPTTHKETITKMKLDILKQAADHVIGTMQNDVPLKLFAGNMNHYNNFQKLRYHGLIHHYRRNGKIVRGHWLITKNGWAFLRGEINLPKYVLIQDNHIVGRCDLSVNVRQVYHGSDAIQTTFEYFSDDGQPIGFKPTISAPPTSRQQSLFARIGMHI